LEEYQRNKCIVPLLPAAMNATLQKNQIPNAMQPPSGSRFSFSSLQPPSTSRKRSRSNTEELERLLLQPLNRTAEPAKLDFWELDSLLFQASAGQELTRHGEETIVRLGALMGDDSPEPRIEPVDAMFGRTHDPFFGSTNDSSVGDTPSIGLSWLSGTKDLFSPPTPAALAPLACTPQIRKVVPMHELVPRPAQVTPASLKVKGKDLFHLEIPYSTLYS